MLKASENCVANCVAKWSLDQDHDLAGLQHTNPNFLSIFVYLVLPSESIGERSHGADEAADGTYGLEY